MRVPFLACAVATSATLASALPQDELENQPTVRGASASQTLTSSAATGQLPVELLLTSIPGLPQSDIPGLPGVLLDGSGIDRVYGSPNGNWIVTALADLPSASDELVFVNGAVVLQEESPAPWTGGMELSEAIDRRCAINDSGDYVFSTSTDAPDNDDYIVTNIGGVWGFAAREGDPFAGFAGAIFDGTLDSPVILADSTVGFAADSVDGTTTLVTDDFLILNDTVLMQEGVTVPPGQFGGGAEFIDNYDANDYWATPDGSSWLVQGDLTGVTGTDDVVIVDGAVVLQEGVIIPGSGFLEPIDTFGIVQAYMDNGGNWFARGNNDVTEQDWIVRNGVVIAQGDEPVIPGSAENWSDDVGFSNGFFIHIGNSQGDWIIGGTTDNPDVDSNAILVRNGTEIICRENDPLDLDGNGLFDDDAFINTFGDDDIHMNDDGSVLLITTVRDGAGTFIGQVLLRLGGDATIGTNYCMANPNSTGATGSISALGSTTASANNVILRAENLPQNEFGFFVNSVTQGFVGNVSGSQGNLCVVGNIGRYNLPGQISNTGMEGAFEITLDLTMTPQPTGAVSVIAGETWNFQAWHRDTVGGSPTSNLTDGLEITFD